MGEADFARVVNQAIARIPAELRACLDNIVITVLCMPMMKHINTTVIGTNN